MRKICFVFSAICIIQITAAQDIQNEVIGSTGNTDSISDIYVSWTIGECLVDKYCNAGCMVTQGFHQSHFEILSVPENHFQLMNVKVYPNPTYGLLNIDLSSLPPGKMYQLSLTNINGRILLQKEIPADEIFQLHLHQFQDGIMMLKVIHSSGSPSSSFKIIKVHP